MSSVRAFIRGTGEVLITLGVVVLLFCVHQLWWTTVEATAAAETATSDIREEWGATPLPRPTSSGPPALKTPAPSDKFALVYIPAISPDYVQPLVEGTTKEDLKTAIGHYSDTALPGEVGNFAIAGHRTTYLQPFHNLDQLTEGDQVIVETDGAWYVYSITGAKPQIVSPKKVDVIYPVPGQVDATPTQKLITLTTCHPKFSARQRLVQHGVLVQEIAKGPGVEPPSALSQASSG